MVERKEDIGWVMSRRALDVEKAKAVRLERRAAAQARHEELKAEDMRNRGLLETGTLEIQKAETIEAEQNLAAGNPNGSMPMGRIVLLVVVAVALLCILIPWRRGDRQS